MVVKNENQIKILREGGRRLATVLHQVVKRVAPGVFARELDSLAEKLIRDFGDTPSFLNYVPKGAGRTFPATLCVSINDEIVHGIPNEKEKILKEGDIVGLDIGLWHEGLCVDMAVTVPVGEISEESKKLIEVTKKALEIGIDKCRVGNKINDIGCAIEKFVKPFKYGIIKDLGGHGVGQKVHETPYIPNFCLKEESVKILPGMVLALEPMLNLGSRHIVLEEDGHTFKTADGKNSAHFEHTVLVTEGEPEIITKLPTTP
ncbi:MAG: type I methionyl aminopeptidase [Patescibacteria group bacterium]